MSILSCRLFVFAVCFLGAFDHLWAADTDKGAGSAGSVAEAFINEHISSAPGYEETMARVQASPLVTERYKKTLTKLYRDALKEAPEYGYGADAVVGGQEHPDRMHVKNSKIDGDRARESRLGATRRALVGRCFGRPYRRLIYPAEVLAEVIRCEIACHDGHPWHW